MFPCRKAVPVVRARLDAFLSRGGLLACLIVAFTLSPGVALGQGALTNGANHSATMAVGGLHTWTFQASANDSFVVSIDELLVSGGADAKFSPRLRVSGPDGGSLLDSWDTNNVEVSRRATLTGTYTVLVSSATVTSAQIAPASYVLTFTKTPGPYTVSPGDEGGALTNGANHAGISQVGDLDTWTFQASANDSFVVSINEVLVSGAADPKFSPRLRVFGPDGASLQDSWDTNNVEVSWRATLTGSYTVVVSSATVTSNQLAPASYVLMFAKMPGSFTVSAGDDGDQLTNGANHPGTSQVGDLDTWTFQASVNDSFVVSIAEVLVSGAADPKFSPRLRVFGPDGASVLDSWDSNNVEVARRATLTGTYTVLVSSATVTSNQVAPAKYVLMYAQTPGPYTVSSGDEGGPLTNGANHAGISQVGDLDTWTFQASANDSFVVSINEVLVSGAADPKFSPRLRVFGPDGASLQDSWDTNNVEVSWRATLTGSYTVVVSSATVTSNQVAPASYVLTWAKTPGPYTVSPSDEGGAMTNGVKHPGILQVGDLDPWTFQASANDNITVSIAEVVVSGTADPKFSPRIRVFGPDGASVADAWDTNTVEVARKVSLSGTYTVLVSSATVTSNQVAPASYTLTLTGASSGGTAPTITAQPASQSIASGKTATMTVAATGTATLTYQWYAGASGTTTSPISGATTSSYTTPALTTTTSYWVRVSNGFGSADSNTATVSIAAGLPTMAIDKASLSFAAVTTGTAFTAQTSSQVVRLTQAGPGTVTWTATSTTPWLVVSPASGTGPATLTISTRFASGLAASQSGAVSLAFTGAGITAGPISVTLAVVSSTAASSEPFGSFDTPAGDATVLAGSIAISGWTLDNIGVQRVEIWRDLQPGETTPPFSGVASDPRNGKVFIANATQVDSARPDVEGLYPTTPASYRAGWGYLLLTWGLFGQGNGTYKLHVFAVDQENNTAVIGSKSVVISNDSATKPFGSIDTPTIGGDASGPNFGWGLTPKVNGAATCKIQPSGVQVSIDSGPLQPVVYGDARTDIAGAFPGFSNTDAAGGHFIVDWSALTPGAHTIGWLITDDCNRADGVGSRFFNVPGGTSMTAAEMSASLAAPQAESADPIMVARGFGELPRVVALDAAGSRTVEVKQGDRIEIRLPRGYESAYQLANGEERRALPTGATWDAAVGAFYWEPAAGFLGHYRLVFSNGSERISVRVVVVP